MIYSILIQVYVCVCHILSKIRMANSVTNGHVLINLLKMDAANGFEWYSLQMSLLFNRSDGHTYCIGFVYNKQYVF